MYKDSASITSLGVPCAPFLPSRITCKVQAFTGQSQTNSDSAQMLRFGSIAYRKFAESSRLSTESHLCLYHLFVLHKPDGTGCWPLQPGSFISVMTRVPEGILGQYQSNGNGIEEHSGQAPTSTTATITASATARRSLFRHLGTIFFSSSSLFLIFCFSRSCSACEIEDVPELAVPVPQLRLPSRSSNFWATRLAGAHPFQAVTKDGAGPKSGTKKARAKDGNKERESDTMPSMISTF